MPLAVVQPRLVEAALSRATGAAFEQFTQEFLSALLGRDFVPLGGVKDGGADGWVADRVYEDRMSDSTFMQASIEEDPEGKIRRTLKRLEEFGRAPTNLLYVTSRAVKHVDRLEDRLTTELDVVIRIREAGYVSNQINNSAQTIAAFEHHLRSFADWLRFPGASPVIAQSKHVKSPAVYVFLRQELERASGDTNMVDAVTDALVLWALEDTDPGTDRLLTQDEILTRICATVPSAKAFVTERLTDRLAFLTSKAREDARIGWYKNGGYCLPFPTRSRIQDENLEDESLRLSVIEGLEERVASVAGATLKPPEVVAAAQVALGALQSLYEHQGLELAAFITGTEEQSKLDTVQDAVRNALVDNKIRPARQAVMGDAILRALHGVFYSSTENERLYLGKLSRTYALLFTLNAEPRLVSYFQEMAGDFYLYVGSDILVRALSERYLDENDQQQRNVLRLAAEAGATLVLTEPVLEEVLGNLRVSDSEYRVNFQPLGGLRVPDAERQSGRILVRAYFHAADDERLGSKGPKSWSAYVNQFVDYSTLNGPQGTADLKGYLVSEFGMVYEKRSELEALVDDADRHELTEALTDAKEFTLARNDALLALAVYGRRSELGEESTITEFGYRTWWLTSEAKILRYTMDLVNDHHGSRYMLRPEFLLNFLALAPSAAEVRQTYRNIFPTVLGVKLAKRMDERVFHSLMRKFREGDEVEPGRRKAQMARLADEMKGDFRKPYLHGFRSEA